MKWFVYIAQCNDDSLYTGITTNITRRISEHNTNNTKGAKSLRGKRPVKLRYSEVMKNRIEAMKREREIKSWNRIQKLDTIENQSS